MTRDEPINWAALLQSALGFGVRPHEFWALSLREWQLLASNQKKSEFRKTDLSRLISSFPDKE